jgi:hypothetical protein
MKMPKPRVLRTLATLSVLTLVATAPGCFQQDNNAEFLRNAPPGKPSEFPDETVSQRRARTRSAPPLGKKDAKRAAAAEKAARKAKAAAKEG